MSFEKIAEQKIREAMENGEFDNLPGRGQPLDLESYFALPEDLRMAYSILKNANVLPPEVELLKEINSLREKSAKCPDKTKRHDLEKQLADRQLKLDLLVEHYRRKQRPAG
ncbi:MAG: DUF1992 domain-containing protein [Acidobacteriia bacterium]|nr:DUF1992 domain-containing protein [Terriglobia bacterium]